jgi:uncharacterized surface protein with fasciclin (FAS1) repeats
MVKTLKVIGCVALLLFVIAGLSQAASETPSQPLLFLRFANFAPGTQVDFSIDPSIAVSSLEYKSFSEWSALPAGTYGLAVNTTGSLATSANPTELVEGNWYTIAALVTEDGTLNTDIIEETFVELAPGTAWVTYVNAVQGGGNIDFLRSEAPYVANLFPLGNEEKQYSWDGLLDYVDTFDFRVVETENPQHTLVEATNVTLRENELYLIATVGTHDPNDAYDLELLIENTSMAEVKLVQGDMAQPGTIIEAALAHTELTGWLEAVRQANLMDTLSSEGPFTVFIPAGFSLENLPVHVRDDSQALHDLLCNYIVQGDLRSQDILKTNTIQTLAGNSLLVGENVKRGFISANIPATNGVIHVVNGLVAWVPQTQ